VAIVSALMARTTGGAPIQSAGESPRDPWVFATAAGVLVAVALLAGLVPAARANRVDPLEALRVE
jgi:ABC-type lipoprotein release transport system permease subunit